MLIRPLLLAALLLSLTACCCPCREQHPILHLPEPISTDQQIQQLNAWSMALPRIKATTVVAGVRLDYLDDKDREKSVNAEGILQINEPRPVPIDTNGRYRYPPADVLLLGKSFDQSAFEAGRNAKEWWFAIRLDTKKAWVGNASRPLAYYDYNRLTAKSSDTILRADLVPDLLGLTPLKSSMTGAVRDHFFLMTVNDTEGTNHLLVAQTDDSKTFLQREIVVDRISGHIKEVRIYSAEGVLAVRSELTDYVPVSFAKGVDKPADVPQFPRKVTVSYPAQHLTVALEFDTITIVPDFKPVVFEKPDFQTEGLRVIPAD